MIHDDDHCISHAILFKLVQYWVHVEWNVPTLSIRENVMSWSVAISEQNTRRNDISLKQF